MNRSFAACFTPARAVSLFFVCLLLFLGPALCRGAEGQDGLSAVLATAEHFFQDLRGEKYNRVWSLLSVKSRGVIVDDIRKGTNGQYTIEQIDTDLKANGMIARSYWKGMLQSFDPATILEESKWEVGFVKEARAELLITHRKSKHPVCLKLFKEGADWRVGLVETFWTRK